MAVAADVPGVSDLTDRVSGIVHEETQTEGRGLALTLDSVYEVDAPGQVDFGGGELAEADLAEIEPEKRDDADDYGWWDLDAGTYVVEYNETLDAENPVVVQPRDAIRARGAFHPTVRATDLDRVPLTTAGIQFKENARVSTLLNPEN